MRWRWWDGLDPGQSGMPTEPMAEHVERCPFCGRDFDRRELDQVLQHYDHQIAAGAPPAIDLTPTGDTMPPIGNVVPFSRGGSQS